MRRILLVSFFTLIFAFVCFWIVKLWGRSQFYPDFQHPLFAEQQLPIEFFKPSYQNLETDLKSSKNLFLDVATTLDQKVVIAKRAWILNEKPLRNRQYEEVKNDVFLVSDFKDFLKNKKIIFNLVENAQAGHEIFFYTIQQMGMEKGENFIVTSPYESLVRALKENQPALIYGTTKPEILKILAMNSMHIVEATNIRADIIIHPLLIRGIDFYTDDLLAEFIRRHKRLIVGPITTAEKEKAVSLNPYGLVILE